jgi:hypothetical protein
MVELRSYIDILNPYKFRETIARESKNADLKVAVVNYLLVAMLFLTFQFFRYAYLPTAPAPNNAPSDTFLRAFASSVRSYNPFHSMASIAITVISALLLPYISVLIIQSVAKALGGKGRYVDLAYLNSIKAPLQGLISYPVSLLIFLSTASGGPALGIVCLLWLVSLIFSIYIYYIEYKILRAVNPTLSRNRAILGFIVAYIIEIVVLAAIAYGPIFARI